MATAESVGLSMVQCIALPRIRRREVASRFVQQPHSWPYGFGGRGVLVADKIVPGSPRGLAAEPRTTHWWEISPLRRAFLGPRWDGQAF